MCYRDFSDEEATEWGKKNFGNWLIEMQDQNIQPSKSVECFFRYYTQGIHYTYNNPLRLQINDIRPMTKNTISLAMNEIKSHPCTQNIIVYRYVNKLLFKKMKEWSNIHVIRKSNIIYDKGFLSTTLTPSTVLGHSYTQNYYRVLKIYVPKGTPCVYVDLISDMHENEVIFCPNTMLKVLSAPILNKYIECKVVNC